MSEPTRKEFRHEVRVPYAHVDQMGVVYYANYLVYFEMARSEMLRECGMPYGELEAQGLRLPVVEARCEYKAPARFDDLLAIRTWCEGIKGPKVRLSYEIMRGDEVVATGHTVHACVSTQGKVIRPFPELHRLLPDVITQNQSVL